jgi:hypothetical protein
MTRSSEITVGTTILLVTAVSPLYFYLTEAIMNSSEEVIVTGQLLFFSEIECGHLDESGERQYLEYSKLYGIDVEVFIASEDKQRRHLTRATLLGKLLGFENNKIGMFLKRNRGEIEGVYCSTGYHFKQLNVCGLKPRSYFLTLGACMMLKRRFEKRSKTLLKSCLPTSVPHAISSSAKCESSKLFDPQQKESKVEENDLILDLGVYHPSSIGNFSIGHCEIRPFGYVHQTPFNLHDYTGNYQGKIHRSSSKEENNLILDSGVYHPSSFGNFSTGHCEFRPSIHFHQAPVDLQNCDHQGKIHHQYLHHDDWAACSQIFLQYPIHFQIPVTNSHCEFPSYHFSSSGLSSLPGHWPILQSHFMMHQQASQVHLHHQHQYQCSSNSNHFQNCQIVYQ